MEQDGLKVNQVEEEEKKHESLISAPIESHKCSALIRHFTEKEID